MKAGRESRVMLREENLLGLKDLCVELHDSVAASGLAPEKERKAWETGVSGCCMQCGEIAGGEELYLLGTLQDEAEQPGNVRRLRLGYCVKCGCEGWMYRLQFRPCPELDWPRHFAERSQRLTSVKRPWLRMPSFRVHPIYGRLAVGIVIVLLLLVLREWRSGGEIPLIRQAKHFKVDVSRQADAHGGLKTTWAQQDD